MMSGVKQQVVGSGLCPDQTIRDTARTALLMGLIGGFAIGLLLGLLTGLLVESFMGVAGWLGLWVINGLSFGLWLGFSSGGTAALQHYTLRLLLAHAGLAPLRYAAFLDHAAGHVLLRRVGGGWVFIHRLLLDYFAALAPGVGVVSKGEEKH